MAISKEKLLSRHRKVRKEFNKMRDAKIYKYAHILSVLAEKFDYSEYTIERIISLSDTDPRYADKNQLKLF